MIDAEKITEIQARLNEGNSTLDDVKLLLDLVSNVQSHLKDNPKLEAWSFIGRLMTAAGTDLDIDFTEDHVVQALGAHGMPKKLIAQLLDENVLAYDITQTYRFFISKRTVRLVRFALRLAGDGQLSPGALSFRAALAMIHEEKVILGKSAQARATRAARAEQDEPAHDLDWLS